MIDFKGSHFEPEIVLWGVHWYVAYPISYRQLEEMMEERGVEVDHSTLNRWVLKYVPLLEQAFRVRKRRVSGSWRMDETYVRTKGHWKYLYRAVDKAGNTVDFLLTAKRDRKALCACYTRRPANMAHRRRLLSIRVAPTAQQSKTTTRCTTQRLKHGRSSTSTTSLSRTTARSSVKCDL